MDSNKTVSISKDTITRLLRDVKQLIINPLTENGIYYVHDDEDMLKGYAMIIGPEDTPYFGGFYFFEFQFPCDYPFSPPTVKYMTNDGTTRFNPNLYKCGKVCVSILNTWHGDKWSSCQTINSILLTLCSLLTSVPFLNEPGQTLHSKDCGDYTKIIEYKNIEYAMCTMLTKLNQKLPQQFAVFQPYMKESFMKNYDKIHTFVENKINTQELSTESSVTIYNVNLFGMRLIVNYNNLMNILEQTKNNIK
jgi:ubiquitin-protein ligase